MIKYVITEDIEGVLIKEDQIIIEESGRLAFDITNTRRITILEEVRGEIALLQPAYDELLETADKTVVGAINELLEIVQTKVDKVEGKGLSTEDFTTEEKEKLAAIEEGANNYVHPETHPPSIIEQDSEHRFVTDEERERWEGNTYVHPETHPPSIIEQDSENRFVTDAEKLLWDAKSEKSQFFTVVQKAANWSDNAQTVSSENFIIEGYAYVVSSSPDNFTEFGDAGIKAGNIATEGEISFICDTVPTQDLTVYVLRIESKATGGRVFNMGGKGGSGVKLVSLEILTPPSKTVYEAGQRFSPVGMVVALTYSDGSGTIATGYSLTPDGPLVLGDTHITVQYTEGGVTRAAAQPITVTKIKLKVPTQVGKLPYNGSLRSADWKDYNSAILAIGGDATGKDAGTYAAVFSIKDTTLYEWEDGTNDDKEAIWVIDRIAGSLTISPSELTLTIFKPSKTIVVDRLGDGKIAAVSYDPEIATIEVVGNSVIVTGVANGKTVVAVSVADGTNHEAPADKQCRIEVDLSKTKVPIPSQNGSLVYTGTSQAPNWSDYDLGVMTISGDIAKTEIGTYTAIFTLKDEEHYEWEDETVEPQEIDWQIKKAAGRLTIFPTTMNLSLSNRTEAISVDRLGDGEIIFESSDPEVATVELIGTTTIVVSAKSTGVANITVSVAEGTNHTAATEKNCFVTVDMTKTAVPIPTQNGSLVYNGSAQTPMWNGYDRNLMTLTGSVNEVEIGIYIVTFTLKNTEIYEWDDGTPLAKEVEWRISSIPGRLSISPTSLLLDLNHRTGTITVDRDGDGVISVENSDPSVATVTLLGETITVVGKASGQVGITVSVAAGSSYGAPEDKICPVVVDFSRTKLPVPTQNGSLTYNGTSQSPSWTGYDNTLMSSVGVVTGVDSGSYEVTFSLLDTEYYEWADGTVDDKVVEWKINPLPGRLNITPATLVLDLYNRSGTIEVDRDGEGEITVVSSDPSIATATLEGTTITVVGKADGQVGITVSVAAGLNHTAPNDKVCPVVVDFSKTKVTVPTQSGSLTYNGVSQNPSWNGYDTNLMSLSGVTAGVNAGEYEVTFTLLDTEYYIWADGSLVTKTVVWTIGKAAGSLSISPTTMQLDDSTPSGVITVTRIGDGVISAVSSVPGVASVSISENTVIVAKGEDGKTTVTVSVAAGTNYTAPPDQTCEVQVGVEPIYGVTWDGSATTKFSRTDGAEGFIEPVAYMAGLSNYGSPFDNIYPWAGMVRVSDPEAGELVAIPKYWYKWTKSGNAMSLKIANQETEGFFVSPAHADRGDGKGERDVVYVGRYHCGASAYKSVSGQSPKVSITRATARSGISNLGASIWQYDFAMYWTIVMLYLVEYADWNSQLAIGYGCGNNSGVQSVGASDSMPYHTGTMHSARTTYGVGCQYRNIEGLWENCMDWCDGIYFSGANVHCIKNPASFSDSSGGTRVSGRPNASSWITSWNIPTTTGFEYALYPSNSSGGSDATYIPDRCYFGSSGVVLRAGGSYSQSLYRGLFYLSGNYAASDSVGSAGCRLQKLPV